MATDRPCDRSTPAHAHTAAHARAKLAVVLELWFDFSCPYAYLASRQARTSLGRRRSTGGRCSSAACSAGSAPVTVRWRRCRRRRPPTTSATCTAGPSVFGVPFQMPAGAPDADGARASRPARPAPRPLARRRSTAIYAAYWQRGEDITRDDVIAGALRGAGVSADDIAAALARADDRRDQGRAPRAAPTRRSRSASSARRPGSLRRAARPAAARGGRTGSTGSTPCSPAGIPTPSRRPAGRARSRDAAARAPRARRSTSTSTSRARSRISALTQLPALAARPA